MFVKNQRNLYFLKPIQHKPQSALLKFCEATHKIWWDLVFVLRLGYCIRLYQFLTIACPIILWDAQETLRPSITERISLCLNASKPSRRKSLEVAAGLFPIDVRLTETG